MKKILSLLASFGLTLTTATTAIACSTGKSGSNLSEVETQANQAKLREEYISAVGKYISKYISLNASKLYLTADQSEENYSFLSATVLSGLIPASEEGEVSIDLTADNITNLNSDVDSVLGLKGSLSEELMTNFSSISEYNFLLVGIDNILNNFSAGSTATISKKNVDDNGENNVVISVTFSMEFTFDYVFNGVVETESITVNKMVSNISGNSELITGLQELTKELPGLVYEATKSDNLFSITDEDLKLSKGAFTLQENAVQQEFINNRINKLKPAINSAASSIIANSSISFDDITANAVDRMYKRNIDHVIQSPDYFETAMFDQHQFGGSLSEGVLNSYFDYKLGFLYFQRSTWVDTQNERILNEFNVTSTEKDFIEWGTIRVGESSSANSGLTLKVNDIEIQLNSISFTYFYRTKKSYSSALNALFRAWRKAWQVYPASKNGLSFQIPNNTTSGYAFWSIVSKNPQFPFETINTNRARWYDSYVETSEFNYFQITTDNGGRTPDVKVTDTGWQVDYSSYIEDGNLTDNVLANSLRLVITVDDVTFNLHWAESPMKGTYIDSIIYGIEKNISFIEKTSL